MSKPRSPPRRRVDGVLLLDKPPGISSNGALQAVRRLYNAAKAGHTGTLDPMATGLLPLCLGEATKFAGELLDADKGYRALVQLGVTTDTADAEGRILESRPVQVDEAQVRQVVASFLGPIEQVPPMYSALKRDGKPLYELARQGIEVERAPRRVVIHSLELSDWTGSGFTLDVACSKGTYIRSLAADIGERLGCGAHLAALRRTAIGRLSLDQAIGLNVLESLSPEELEARLNPADALLVGVPRADLTEGDTGRVLHGQAIRWAGDAGTRLRLYGADGRFLGTGEVGLGGLLQPRRLVATQ